jgi:hypothetical protein
VHDHPGVAAQHLVGQPGGRVLRVEGHPRRPGPQDADDTGHRGHARPGEQAHPVAGGDSGGAQPGGHRGGGPVEAGVRHGGVAGVDGDRVGRAADLGVDQRHDAVRLPGRRLGCRHDGGQFGEVLAGEALHRVPAEQPGREVPREVQRPGRLPAQQAQPGGRRGGARGDGRRRDRAARLVGQREPGEAETRRAHRAWPRPGDRAQPGQVQAGDPGVLLRGEPRRPQAFGNPDRRVGGVHGGEHRQGVGERAHQRLHAVETDLAARPRDVDCDVALPAPPCQAAGVPGQKQVEQRHAVGGGPLAQRRGELVADVDLVRHQRWPGWPVRITVVGQRHR